MIDPFRTPAALAAGAYFDGQGAKRLGMPRDSNPLGPGRSFRMWHKGWDSIPSWRRTEFRAPANSPGPPTPPRPCPDPNPPRYPYE